MTLISAHSGPRRKLITLTEWGALLQALRGDKLPLRHSIDFGKAESKVDCFDGAGEGT